MTGSAKRAPGTVRSVSDLPRALMFNVGAYGAFLATRPKAKTIRDTLEKWVGGLGPEAEVVINFAGVDAMTIGVADEFLGKFYTSVAVGDISAPAVLLSGLNDETLEAVEVCLERRDLLAAVVTDGNVHLAAAPDFLRETYEHAITLGTFRASELSNRLDITLSNTNNRLKRLVAAGAIRRERSNPLNRGGKEFLYFVPRPKACPTGVDLGLSHDRPCGG
jgi:hypothetical protein